VWTNLIQMRMHASSTKAAELSMSLSYRVAIGSSANDTFVVYDSADVLIGARSTDTVYAAVNFTLPTNVDTLFLEGGSGTYGTGNNAPRAPC
jgi:hypothetical protein